MTSPERVEVLRGRLEPDLEWVVRVWGHAQELLTLVDISRGGRLLAGKGFGGPALSPSSVLNSYWGKTDGLPFVVLVRVASSVDRVVARTFAGPEVELVLSEPYEAFGGLRFGFAAMPGDQTPTRITAWSGTTPPAGPAWPDG